MSNTIQIKRSSTAAAIPTAGQLAVGELAVNLADKKLFTKDTGGAIITLEGERGVPQNAQNSNYTLSSADNGKHLLSTNSGAQTITIPTNASVALPVGTAVSIINNGTTAITISASGVTLKQAGTANTGNRTVAVNGVVTLIKVSTDTWFVSGVGLT